jgi:hypothetical protein
MIIYRLNGTVVLEVDVEVVTKYGGQGILR